MALNSPTFAGKSELCRYVDEAERMSGNRPASTTFRPNPGEQHLSINSREIEPIADIAQYYRIVLQRNSNSVAICIHNVFNYNDAARKAGVRITKNVENAQWEYDDEGTKQNAYRHRPVRAQGMQPASPSHCGVELIRVLDELNQRKFARRMANRRFHLV